jgi:hypothetical protein
VIDSPDRETAGSASCDRRRRARRRDALARLAHEQAALRRVATLVAQGVRPLEIFSAVSEEVGHLVGTNTAC